MSDKLPRRARALLNTAERRRAFDDSAEVAAICRTIATARKQAGLSQEEVAQRSGVPQAEISRIESGMLSRGPTLLTLVRLTRAMQQTLRVQFEAQQEAHPDVVRIVGHSTPASVSPTGIKVYVASGPLRSPLRSRTLKGVKAT